MQALAEKHTAEYHEALASLGIVNIDKFPKASDHMAEIIEMCKSLIAKGAAYAADGNVWFDVTKDNDYGKLSNRRVEDQESGLRQLEGSGKKNPADFALWKAAKKDEPSWDSPWGKGRPGWHIECSAMSIKYLGASFDIHGGGMDKRDVPRIMKMGWRIIRKRNRQAVRESLDAQRPDQSPHKVLCRRVEDGGYACQQR